MKSLARNFHQKLQYIQNFENFMFSKFLFAYYYSLGSKIILSKNVEKSAT